MTILTQLVLTSAALFAPELDEQLKAWQLCQAAHDARPALRRTSGTWRACVGVARASTAAGLGEQDTIWLVATASHESDFRPRRGRSGEIGTLQIIPRYWCPGGRAEGCDSTRAGVRAWAKLKRYAKGDRWQASAFYNGGYRRPNPVYATRIERRANAIRRALARGAD